MSEINLSPESRSIDIDKLLPSTPLEETTASTELQSVTDKRVQSMVYTDFSFSTLEKFQEALTSLEEQFLLNKEMSDLLAEVQDFRHSLSYATVSAIDPDSIQKLSDYQGQLQNVLKQLQVRGTSELTEALTQVLKDMEQCLSHADNMITWFANDNKFSDNLTKAMSATIALNDRQKEELRDLQYAYSQFIKIYEDSTIGKY